MEITPFHSFTLCESFIHSLPARVFIFSNMAYTIISLFILASYVIAVVWRWGVPESVSQTFFSIRHKWIFSAVMVVSFALMWFALQGVLLDDELWLAFLTCSGGVLIGFAPNLRDSLEERVHMFGAMLLAVFSQWVVALVSPCVLWLWVAWLPFAFGSHRVFVAEMIGAFCLYWAVLA